MKRECMKGSSKQKKKKQKNKESLVHYFSPKNDVDRNILKVENAKKGLAIELIFNLKSGRKCSSRSKMLAI